MDDNLGHRTTAHRARTRGRRALVPTLALILITLVHAATTACAQERAPWHLGPARLIWSYVPPHGERGCCTPQPATIVVHPQGGVVAVMQRDNMELTISRVTAAGRLQWQTHISNPGGWVGVTHAHVAFIDERGEAAIVISLTFALIGLDRDGALLWQRAAHELGFAQLGAIRVVRDGHFVRLLVGGWSLPPERGELRPRERTRIAAAELQLRGVPIWQASIPSIAHAADNAGTPSPQRDEPSDAREERLLDEAWHAEHFRRTVAVPLRATLATGGGMFLIGCGGLGTIVTARDIPRPEIPGPPCEATQPIALMRIDGAGRVADASPFERHSTADLELPGFVTIDAPLQPERVDDGPAHWPTLLWHGPRASELVNLLQQKDFWDDETHVAYGGAAPTWLHIPAADVVGVGSDSYLLFAQRDVVEQGRGRIRARLRVLLVRVGPERASILIDARVAPTARLRLALDERAIYALSRNRVLRIPIIRGG